ncbi:MAG: HD-GYP domain-containing protein [Phycisphaerales bacterium]|nr:HD-GYP domain-containing protein [Phycisphaerales bacterium]
MSLHEIKHSTSAGYDSQEIWHGVLENLAMRMRPGGLCLMMLRPDGKLAFGDASSGMFFVRYVMPLLQYGDESRQAMRERIEKLSTGAGTAIWQIMPGVILSAFPYVEKRQIAGAVVLAGKSETFRLGEEVVRVCGQLGLDGIWLNQQAEELPSHDEASMQRQSRLLLSMMRDQIRLNGLEQELDSLSGQLANTYEELSLIYQISGGMKVNRQASDFFKQACLDVMEVMGVRGMGVALQGNTLRRQEPVIYGSLSLPPGKVHRLADQLVTNLTERKSALLINDLAADKSLAWMGEYATQILAVPLQRQEQVLGCLFALDKNADEFDSMDSKLLNSIANESAIYLENSMLFEDVHDLMMGLLHSLTSAVDAKDAYTCGHSERVALLSRHLARQIQLPEAEIERIYMAGLLHDVGKIGVPENVLQKTGRLTAEEFEQMKRHPQIGARILRDIKQIEDIIPGVLHHHERYDGRGYPAALAGERIPLMGRIICLADCFDAMTSNRTYRKALPLEVALTEIRRCSGTQFDPRLTESFLQVGAERYRELLREQEQKTKTLMDLQESLRAA